MAIVGYARVSSLGQSLEVQVDKFTEVGVDEIFKEKLSGVDVNRPRLIECLKYLRKGDTLLVTRIDRLARSTNHLHKIVSDLTERGVAFKVLDQPNIETVTSTGKLMFAVLAAIAEFENDIRSERQMDGIRKAKQNGVKFGRKVVMTDDVRGQIIDMRARGMLIKNIMQVTDLSKASVYRAIGGH